MADFPDLGRDASHLRPGCQEIETASHSIFYRKTMDVVLIARILHQPMDSLRHL
jgi:plasmid stabilization system protein ParE